MKNMRRYSNDISIVFGGAAGQGIQTIASALVSVLKRSGFHVFACTEFMSRVRGGSNSTQVRITGKKRQAYVRRIDFLFALNAGALEHLKTRIAPTTIIFADKSQVQSAGDGLLVDTPITAFARQAGNPIYSNTAAVAVALGLLGIPQAGLDDYLREIFAGKGEAVVANNIEAARLGYAFGRQAALREEIEVEIAVEPEKSRPKELLLDGTAAVGIGAVAAGCNFISSYPMSPGTGVLTFLAQRARDFNIVVDQAEDEIAAVNTALGASYAGARAIVTTSGGGFALMEEGISLADRSAARCTPRPATGPGYRHAHPHGAGRSQSGAPCRTRRIPPGDPGSRYLCRSDPADAKGLSARRSLPVDGFRAYRPVFPRFDRIDGAVPREKRTGRTPYRRNG